MPLWGGNPEETRLRLWARTRMSSFRDVTRKMARDWSRIITQRTTQGGQPGHVIYESTRLCALSFIYFLFFHLIIICLYVYVFWIYFLLPFLIGKMICNILDFFFFGSILHVWSLNQKVQMPKEKKENEGEGARKIMKNGIMKKKKERNTKEIEKIWSKEE